MAFDVSTGRYVSSRIRLNFGHIFRQWANALQHQHKSGPGLHFTRVKFPTPLCFNFYYFDVVFDSFYALLARTSFHALITLILVHDRGSQ